MFILRWLATDMAIRIVLILATGAKGLPKCASGIWEKPLAKIMAFYMAWPSAPRLFGKYDSAMMIFRPSGRDIMSQVSFLIIEVSSSTTAWFHSLDSPLSSACLDVRSEWSSHFHLLNFIFCEPPEFLFRTFWQRIFNAFRRTYKAYYFFFV